MANCPVLHTTNSIQFISESCSNAAQLVLPLPDANEAVLECPEAQMLTWRVAAHALSYAVSDSEVFLEDIWR
jgi:hypothetical protein